MKLSDATNSYNGSKKSISISLMQSIDGSPSVECSASLPTMETNALKNNLIGKLRKPCSKCQGDQDCKIMQLKENDRSECSELASRSGWKAAILTQRFLSLRDPVLDYITRLEPKVGIPFRYCLFVPARPLSRGGVRAIHACLVRFEELGISCRRRTDWGWAFDAGFKRMRRQCSGTDSWVRGC